ncbi:MAG: hypothetical protein KDB23_11515, partial [Planctomycetales bacterium]|nr:hypothetical protein [Planctomycetales bacterium]
TLLWKDWEETAAATEPLAELIERLACRLGTDAVSGVRLRAGKLPEQAWAAHQLTGDRHARHAFAQLESTPAAADTADRLAGKVITPLAGQRPLRLLKQPIAIQLSRKATNSATDTEASPATPLARFHDGATWHDIVKVWGPERIETAWWRGACVRRDYYRVASEAGTRFWIFCDLAAGTWFLHGTFS